ncbi:hypothetical protein BofuT4_uP040230.1 [Botrytis cinerea T4]|uniref:Uncharacterized protein n=1 Tax=Botryotinia fuckeliana (strain T4) TaxID=999810 RepID=G2Y172_BOTF4|nr:hypothetical protein BofuT4_uP040230.1 [Botrytis cinerea T4]
MNLTMLWFEVFGRCAALQQLRNHCDSKGESEFPAPRPVSIPLQNSTAQYSRRALRPRISHRSENPISLKMRTEVLNAAQIVLGASHEATF